MAHAEFGQQRRDPDHPGAVGRGDAQPAAWTVLQLADRAFGLVKVAGDALAMLEIDVPCFGQAELARGPVQQLRTEPRFQFLHLAADGGLGQAQRARGGDEAAQFGHLDEDQGVVEIA